jgi:hypothetical protein
MYYKVNNTEQKRQRSKRPWGDVRGKPVVTFSQGSLVLRRESLQGLHLENRSGVERLSPAELLANIKETSLKQIQITKILMNYLES